MAEQTKLDQSLVEAVDSAQSSSDPDARIAALLRVLEIEPQLDSWPFEQSRQDLKGWASNAVPIERPSRLFAEM